MNLATSAPEEDENAEWLPLGVFAIYSEDKEQEPVMILQLAVSKQGTMGGTYHNLAIGTTLPINGRVDLETQRAAWTIGDNKSMVMETGVGNLTQNEATLLVHFGTDRTQKWLLARLEEPKEGEPQS
jgi:hypothetical protein